MFNVSEVSHISKEESSQGTIRSCLTKIRPLLSCLLLMGGAYLTLCCRLAVCSDQPDASPARTSTAQNPAVARLTKRPVTVADSIRMTRLGDPSYTAGAPSNGMVAKFSPDRKQFVVILRKGNLEGNTNEYSLVLFQTCRSVPIAQAAGFGFASLILESARHQNVVWLDDNDTILFLGERPGEQTATLFAEVQFEGAEETYKSRHQSHFVRQRRERGEGRIFSSQSSFDSPDGQRCPERNRCNERIPDRSDTRQRRRAGRRLRRLVDRATGSGNRI